MKHRNHFLLALLVLAGALVSYQGLQAKLYRTTNDLHFFRAIHEHELAIVLFYNENRSMQDDIRLKEKIRRLKNDFSSVSRSERVVAFIRVNTAHHKIQKAVQRYEISSEQPTFMLFRKGRPYKDKNGTTVKMSGFLYREDIVDLIEDNFSTYIDDILERERELEERRAVNAALYWGPGWYAGYGPYYNGYEFANPWWGGGYYPSW